MAVELSNCRKKSSKLIFETKSHKSFLLLNSRNQLSFGFRYYFHYYYYLIIGPLKTQAFKSIYKTLKFQIFILFFIGKNFKSYKKNFNINIIFLTCFVIHLATAIPLPISSPIIIVISFQQQQKQKSINHLKKTVQTNKIKEEKSKRR